MLHPNEKLVKPKKVYYFIQWIATLGVFMLLLQIGINIGWASPNLARLGAKDSPIPLTADQASWVASLMGMGGFGGAIIGAFCIEYVGSKKSTLLVLSLMSISWICLIIANSVEWLYLARTMAGAACSMAFGCFSVYLGEVSATEIRGTLISIAVCGSPLGTVVSSVAETYLEMKVSSSIYLAVCLAAIVLFLWISDSPYYLMGKGDFEGARKSINLYFSGYEVDQNFDAIKEFVEADSSQSMKEKFRELKVPAITKSMILIGILFILPHISSMIILTSYMQIILTNAKFDLVEPEDFVIYANFIVFVASFLTVNLIDKFGRRLLLIISGIGTSMSMIGLGVLFYLLKMEVDSESTRWLAVLVKHFKKFKI